MKMKGMSGPPMGGQKSPTPEESPSGDALPALM
jgi:hypothetical protein